MSIANFSPRRRPSRCALHARRRDAGREDADPRARGAARGRACRSADRGGGVVRLRLERLRRSRRRQRRLRGAAAAAQDRRAAGEPRQPVPREGPQDRSPGEARGAASPSSTRAAWGAPTSSCSTRVSPPRVGNGRFVLRQHGAARRAARGARAASRIRPSWTGTGRIPSCVRSTSRRSTIEDAHARAAARRGQDPGGGGGRAARSTRSRSATARRCSSASTCSRPTSRCGWRSR